MPIQSEQHDNGCASASLLLKRGTLHSVRSAAASPGLLPLLSGRDLTKTTQTLSRSARLRTALGSAAQAAALPRPQPVARAHPLVGVESLAGSGSDFWLYGRYNYGRSESTTHTVKDVAKLLRQLERFIRDWWFTGAATLLAGLAGITVGLVAAAADHSAQSLPWAILLVSSSAGASAWLLHKAAQARQRLRERHKGLRLLRETGERLAIYDRETGLLAYWYFSLRLDQELARCARHGQTFSLLLLEAQTGRWASDDESALFQYMAESFRNCDLVAHLGNLRFIVLLTNTDAQGAMVVRDHLQADEQLRSVTARIASFPTDGESCEALLTAAGASADVVADTTRMASSMRSGRRELTTNSQDQAGTAA